MIDFLFFHEKPVTILVLLAMICSCTSTSKDSNASGQVYSVDEFSIKKGSDLDPNKWTYAQMESGIIYYPSKWKEVPTDKAYFFARIEKDSIDKNEFSVLAKYKLGDISMSLTEYLKNTYSELNEDTVEIFKGYTVKKLVFPNFESFYCEFFTEMDGKEYIAMSMYTTRNGYLYDLTLKVREERREEYYEYFQNMLYNIRDEGGGLFDKVEELKEVELIDLASL